MSPKQPVFQEALIVTTQSLKTPKEVGIRLGVSEVTVLRLHDSGALPGVIIRSGARKRTIRFRDEAIEKFITSREQRVAK